MAVSFDDLIPKAPQPPGLSFDDLISQQQQLAPAPNVPQTQGQSYNPLTAEALRGASRALEANLPFVDRAVAGTQSVLPQGYGGTGQDYATNLATEQAKNAQFAKDNYWTDLAGSVADYAPLTLVGGAGSLGARVAQQAGLATALGALQGVSSSPDLTNNEETSGRAARGGLIGFGLGAGIPIVGAGIGKAISPLAAALSKGPGQKELASLGDDVSAAYDKVKSLGAAYSPDKIQQLTNKIAADATEADIDPGLNPKATAIIQNLQNRSAKAVESGQPVTLGQLDKARQFVNDNLSGLPEPKQARFGQLIKSNIDDFINKAEPQAMMAREPSAPVDFNAPSDSPPPMTAPAVEGAAAAPSAQDASEAIGTAHDLAQRQFKAQALMEALGKAKDRASVSGVGGNIENTTRQKLLTLRDNESWSPDETAQLNTMINSPAINMAREIGRYGPKGNVLMGLGELGLLASGHPAAMALGAGGMAAQGVGALMRRNAQNRLLSTVLAGGQAPAAPALQLAGPSRAALAAALAARQQSQLSGNINNQ